MRIRILSVVLLLISSMMLFAQDVKTKQYLKDGTIEEQINHVIEQSSRWETYKMITDGWVSALRKNTFDTLKVMRSEIASQKMLLTQKDSTISQLENSLSETREALSVAQKEKNSFRFLGSNMSKGFYQSITWFAILTLAILLSIMFGLYNKSFSKIKRAKGELEETKNEFEAYRQDARKKYEDLVKQHHKEIIKLKGL